MKLLPFLFVLMQAPAYITAFKWYSLGNRIEGGGTNDLTGQVVATSRDGSMIAVSAPTYTPESEFLITRNGRVTVYRFDPIRDSWDKVGGDLVGNPGNTFGVSLAISEDGTSIIVGFNSLDAGSVRVYVLDGTMGQEKWIQKGQTLIGKNAVDKFGSSVDISDGGSIIAVGSPGHAIVPDKNSVGLVQVFRWDVTAAKWEQMARAIEGKKTFDNFGASVSLSTVGKLAIGAPISNDAEGYVQIVEFDSVENDWNKIGDLVHADATPGDFFGASVSMSFDGSSVAVGCPRCNGQGDVMKHSGKASVHDYNKTTEIWTLRGQVLTGYAEGDNLGASVSLSDDGNQLAVGAPFSKNSAGNAAGDVFVYHFLGDVWENTDLEIEGTSDYSYLGTSVAISGSGFQVIAGAPDEGYAMVYILSETAPPTQSPTEAPEISSAPSERSLFITFQSLLCSIFLALSILNS